MRDDATEEPRGPSPEALADMHRYQAELAEAEGDAERAAFHRDLARIHDRACALPAPPEPPARRSWGRRLRR